MTARTLAAVVLVVALASCATPTPYGPRTFSSQGYEDERLGVRTWVVRVGAGYGEEWRRLRLFALYRAAEIASAHGFAYFLVEEGLATDEVSAYAPGAPDRAAMPVDPAEQQPPKRLSGPRTVVARVRIRLVDEADIGPHALRVVDARRVLARLRPVVGGEME